MEGGRVVGGHVVSSALMGVVGTYLGSSILLTFVLLLRSRLRIF